jgi:hypothetical protein
MKKTIKTKDATKGGFLVGKAHSEGGIKGINVDTGEPIEVEGGEVVITKPAVQSEKKYEFEGRLMTPKEILSELNSDHGGVEFAKGGEVPEEKYSDGGVTKFNRTTEKENVEKEDKAESEKYSILYDAVDEEIAKWSILRGLLSKEQKQRRNEIDRKIANLREQRDLYELKRKSGSELLQQLSKVFTKAKLTEPTLQEVPVNKELVAPNGTQSALTEEQYYKVRTDEFKNWYGDWQLAYDLENYGGVSKALNENTQEPLILYHGSKNDFARWRFDSFPAAYFADNRSYAQWFANVYGEGSLYQVFVDMKNPIDVRSFGVEQHSIRTYLDYLKENYLIDYQDADPNYAKSLKKQPELTEQYLDYQCRFWEYIRHHNTGLLTYLRDKTFIDGIIMFENNPSDIIDGQQNVTGSYVVFRTEQIKWASAGHFNILVKDARFKGRI